MSGKTPVKISKSTTSVPPSVSAALKGGTPKRTAMSTGKKPTSMVRVGK